jgi:hypothetical protein
MYSLAHQQLNSGTAVQFEKVGVAPTTANIANNNNAGLTIKEPGLYQISYSVNVAPAPTIGGQEAVFYLMDLQVQKTLAESVAPALYGQFVTVNLFYRVWPTPGIAVIALYCTGKLYCTGNRELQAVQPGNFKAVSANLCIHKISA